MASSFSVAILHGMRQHGFDDAAIAAILGITPSRVKAVTAGRANLTERQLVTIERETGKSVGQLAALKIEPRGGPFTRLANKLAPFRSTAPRSKRRASRTAQ